VSRVRLDPVSARLSGILTWPLVLLGILLRRQYLFNRSFWLDECLLAVNILNRSFAGLFRRLTHHQHAPVGFLLMEAAIRASLGTSELALRLPSLLASIVSLVLLRAVARRTVASFAAALAIALFALSEPLT